MTHDLTCILTVCDDGLTVHFQDTFDIISIKRRRLLLPQG